VRDTYSQKQGGYEGIAKWKSKKQARKLDHA
jgi:hypothetical protein